MSRRTQVACGRGGWTRLWRQAAGVSCALLLAVTPAQSVKAELAIVVSPEYAVDSATVDDIRLLYLGKSKSLGGAKLKPLDQAKGTGPRAEFLSSVIGKNEAQLKSYWSRLIFSGKGKPPKAVSNDAAVKAQVSSDDNKIGYIDAAHVDHTVKTLLRVP